MIPRALIAMFCLILSPALPGAEKVQSYQVRGVIRELRPEKKEMIIKHETIPGYMEAMVMPFTVRDAKSFKQVAPGDTVIFTLRVTDTEDWMENVKVITRGKTAVSASKAVSDVKPGTRLPLKGIRLLDQDGREFDLGEIKGKAVALTFFFTRCPFPKMCPLLAAKFTAAQKLLVSADAKNTLLISVSIDPENDRPEVLRLYARTHQVNPAYWRLATGDLKSITQLALLCGVNFWEEKGLVNHSLRTLVIGPDGKVRRVLADNEWSAEELVQALVGASKE